MAPRGDTAGARKPTSCLGHIVCAICCSADERWPEASRPSSDEAKEAARLAATESHERRMSERSVALGLAEASPQIRRSSVGRRGGVQTTTSAVLKGLKEQFDKMERLEDANDCAPTAAVGTEDIDFVRILQPSQFKAFLRVHGISPAEYGKGNFKSVKDLWSEVVFRECELQQVKRGGHPTLQRFVRVIMTEVEAKCAHGEAKHLMLQDDAKMGLSRRDLYTRMSKKMYDDETVEKAMWRCIVQNMGFEEDVCKKHFKVVSETESREFKMSSGFPGLPTSYHLHVVRMQVADPQDPVMKKLGLPSGNDFKTTTHSLLGPPGMRKWTWCTHDAYEAAVQATAGAIQTANSSFSV